MPVTKINPKNKDRLLTKYVLHASWVPDDPSGRFLVWGESEKATKRKGSKAHPFQLQKKELANVLSIVWPSLGSKDSLVQQPVRKAWLVVPGDNSAPSPSIELQALLEQEIAQPTSWGTWQINTFEISDPIRMLGSFDPESAVRNNFVRIGQDLEFWHRLVKRISWSIRRHEYLPVLSHKHSLPASKKTAKKSGFNYRTGWEFAQSVEDRIIADFSASIPSVCQAMWLKKTLTRRGEPLVHDAVSLVRNFLVASLEQLVHATRFTLKVKNSVEGTFISHALDDHTPASKELTNTTVWTQWVNWYKRLQRKTQDADERVCFRLVEAEDSSSDDWHLEWLLTSRRDPSILVPLEDFWANDALFRPSSRRIKEVLLQLGQAARIYNDLWEGMNSAAPSHLTLNRDETLEFLKLQAPILQAAGFRVIIPSWWTVTGRRRLRLRLTTSGSSQSTAVDSSGLFGFDSIVEFNAEIIIDGQPITAEEWEQIVTAKKGLVQIRGEWMELQLDEVIRLEEFWNLESLTVDMSVAELIRSEADADSLGVEVIYQGDIGAKLSALRNSGALKILDQPLGLTGTLRDYQIRGFSWLMYLQQLGFGACLADDMGLGKTIQVLAAILEEKNRNEKAGTTLLVAPTSVLGNWQREAARFTPSLSTYIHHGTRRVKDKRKFNEIVSEVDIVIVSFGVLRIDNAMLSKFDWHRLVVDESQHVKNPKAAVTRAVRKIRAPRRIAMTGTPVENRLMDLWSLFSFINPDYLGNMTQFRANFERPIMRNRNQALTNRLRGMVQPFILRRMKSDKSIIKELPDKVEQNAFCNLTKEQATLYQAVLRTIEESLEDAEGMKRRGLILSALTRLKQICNHPAQFLQDGSAFTVSRSHKLTRVCEMLDEIKANEESVLVFTQYSEVGRLLETLFRQRYDGSIYFLHGGTSRFRREHMVEEFQNPDSKHAIFVLSLRAGGTGITLTKANHVIHFDRWWNPAVENQATDRAYRIGQKRSVFVHKMVTMGTLEERIDELIESKKRLTEDIIGSEESWLADLDNDAFRQMIALNTGSAVVD